MPDTSDALFMRKQRMKCRPCCSKCWYGQYSKFEAHIEIAPWLSGFGIPAAPETFSVVLQVHVLTSSPTNKSEVTIDIEEAASKAEVKQKLVSATGIPFEHQKVVLSGIGQLAVADKR